MPRIEVTYGRGDGKFRVWFVPPDVECPFVPLENDPVWKEVAVFDTGEEACTFAAQCR